MLIQRMPTSLSLKNYWRQLPDLSLSHILVWWFVFYAQIAAGLGLLAGGLATLPKIRDIAFLAVFGDLVTRFSGIFFMGWRSLFRFEGKLGSGD